MNENERLAALRKEVDELQEQLYAAQEWEQNVRDALVEKEAELKRLAGVA